MARLGFYYQNFQAIPIINHDTYVHACIHAYITMCMLLRIYINNWELYTTTINYYRYS